MKTDGHGCRHMPRGGFISRPETLTSGFFVNLCDMGNEWKASASAENVYDVRDRCDGSG